MDDPLAELARLEGVPRAVAVARAAVDVVLADRGHQRVDANSRAAALLAGARATVQLAEEPEEWLAGAVRLATEIPQLATQVRTAPGQVLARMHGLLAHGRVPDERLGRLSERAGVGERMAGLTRLLSSPTSAPAPVLAAVAHAEVATVSPFGAGDGILARALERLVLMEAGFDPYGLIVVEAGHLALRDDYRAGLSAYGTGRVSGVRMWLLHGMAAICSAAEATGGRT